MNKPKQLDGVFFWGGGIKSIDFFLPKHAWPSIGLGINKVLGRPPPPAAARVIQCGFKARTCDFPNSPLCQDPGQGRARRSLDDVRLSACAHASIRRVKAQQVQVFGRKRERAARWGKKKTAVWGKKYRTTFVTVSALFFLR